MTRRLLFSCIMLCAAGAWGAGEPIRVRLIYANEPLTYVAKPEFSLRNPAEWIRCLITPIPDGSFLLERPSPGRYMIHVIIDENKSNPGDYPGDYNIFQEFDVTDTEPQELVVHMSRLLRVTQPWDNARGIEGAPELAVSRYALTSKRPITFSWDPILPGAEYRYTLFRASRAGRTQLFQADTSTTSVTVTLAPLPKDEVYQFGFFATKNGKTVGTLFVHDSGSQAWTIPFRVVGRSLVPWIAGGLLVVVLSALLAAFGPWPGAYASMGGVVLLLAGGITFYKHVWPELQAPPLVAPRGGVDRELVNAFKREVPLPLWWNEVEPELPIHSLSDLQSVWMSGGTMDERRGKKFYKAAYKAVEEHPEIPDLVPFGLYLMSHVAADAVTRRALEKFWIDHFFDYKQRVDNCANCMTGDTTSTLARDYAAGGAGDDPRSGIELIQRLVKERDSEISPYNMALTLQEMARLQFRACDKPGALATLREGLRRFPAGWQADQLKQTLAQFESEDSKACAVHDHLENQPGVQLGK